MYHDLMNTNILTVNQFAEKIGTSRLTVLRLIKSGKIIAFRLSDSPKSPYRIRESEIDRLISFELNKKYIKKEK